MTSDRPLGSRPLFSLPSLLEIGCRVPNHDQATFLHCATATVRALEHTNPTHSLIGDLRPIVTTRNGSSSLLQTLRGKQRPPPTLEFSVTSQIEAVWRIVGFFFIFPKCRDDIVDAAEYFKDFDVRYQSQLCGSDAAQALHPVDFVLREWQHFQRLNAVI